jgi:hypothetical protein
LRFAARRDLDAYHRALTTLALGGTSLRTQPLHEAPDGAVADRVAMRLFQPRPDCRRFQAPRPKGDNLIAVGLDGRALLGRREGWQRGGMERLQLGGTRQLAL